MSRAAASVALLWIGCALTCSCPARGPAPGVDPAAAGSAAASSLPSRPRLGSASRFGIDYVFPLQAHDREPTLARTLASAGAGWVNFAEVRWGAIEPRPPVDGRHRYDWTDLDEAVRLWQGQGFALALSLRLGKGWFAGPRRYEPAVRLPLLTALLPHSDRLPAAEHMPSYRAWIRALVERYDGDGTDDMPGLAAPILHLQVGNEYANPAFWTGTLADYETLLRETAAAARAAQPQVRIISNGIRFNDLFHDDPEGKQFEQRFATFLDRLPSDAWRQEWNRARTLTEGTIALASEFDILDAGGNGPYAASSAGYHAWVRARLRATGRVRPIWDMEARCEPRLACEPTAVFHLDQCVPDGAAIIKRMRTPLHRDYERVVAWYRAEQARVLVQVFASRFAAGFEKVFVGMPDDWDGTPAALGTANPFLGLCDRRGTPWPALAALHAIVTAIDGFASAAYQPAPDDVVLVRFGFDGGRAPAWITWLREARPRGVDDPLPHRRVRLDAVPTPATAQPIPTARNEPGTVRYEAGQPVELDLDPTPVILAASSPTPAEDGGTSPR